VFVDLVVEVVSYPFEVVVGMLTAGAAPESIVPFALELVVGTMVVVVALAVKVVVAVPAVAVVSKKISLVLIFAQVFLP